MLAWPTAGPAPEAARPGPTRRAGRLVREIFLDELGSDAVLLPRIVALGDIDEDELAFAEASESWGGAAWLDIPPKLGELDRRLTLARLVAGHWPSSARDCRSPRHHLSPAAKAPERIRANRR